MEVLEKIAVEAQVTFWKEIPVLVECELRFLPAYDKISFCLSINILVKYKISLDCEARHETVRSLSQFKYNNLESLSIG